MGNCNAKTDDHNRAGQTTSEKTTKKENVMTNNEPHQIQEIANIAIDEETQAAIDAPFFNSRNSDLLFRHCLRVCGIQKEDSRWNEVSQ